MDAETLYRALRARLIGDLHIGRVRAGARLPSIRQTAAAWDLDHRVVAKVYGRMQQENLVDVRGRAGVFVARVDPGAFAAQDLVRWVAGLTAEARGRRIDVRQLPALLEQALRPGVRCVVMESTEDHEVALSAELREDFGLDPTIVRLDAGAGASGRVERARQRAMVERACKGAELVVTTAFHVAEVRPAAVAAGAELVVVAVNPDLVAMIARRLTRGGVTAVVVDESFAERARSFLPAATDGRLRLLYADDPAVRELSPDDDSVMYTRAARRRLGLEEFHLIARDLPFISAQTAQDVAESIVRINLSRSTQSRPGAADGAAL